MPDSAVVTGHYTHGDLVDAIRDGVARMGKTIDDLAVDDLAPVDEFHIGGRTATEAFLDQLAISEDHHILDVGCGLGGGSRFAANRYSCQVTGVDLTAEYVQAGNTLCEWLALNSRVQLNVENATSLACPDGTFDRAFMMHVGMNIADKEALARELHRVVCPGGKVGIYDVMQITEGDLMFPVPWATEADGSAVSPPSTYRAVLQAAGFEIVAERNRREFALAFFEQLRSKVAAADGPPPLGLHILMGKTAPLKVKNMIENISRNLVAPVEIIAAKRR